MEEENRLVVFQDKKIRRISYNGEWHYSLVDIVAVLTEQRDYQTARKYWNKLIQRLREEGSEVVTNCHRLKLPAEDGKLRETDCANTKSLFRIIQSIPSPKAEPFKLWLAELGKERIDEIQNPELAQERMKQLYEQKGYSKSWIDKRLRGIAVRQDLTDEWKKRGIESQGDFSILTSEISKATFGMTPAEYKRLKGLTNENLRDHMRDLELIFTMLGEASTAEIERIKDPAKFAEHKKASREGGNVAKKARLELEKKTKRPVVSKENYLEVPEKERRKSLPEHKKD
jgi:DNA-damage-inducible protein D